MLRCHRLSLRASAPSAAPVVRRAAARRLAAALSIAIGASAIVHLSAQQAPVAGPNRNVAGGPVSWQGTPFYSPLKEGDPYGQRQNEISCGQDSRNARLISCAFNDYTPVDLPGLSADGETGDAWIGLAWSTDFGATFRHALLAGYPQDTSPEGLASPLHGYDAAADPTFRVGPNGRSYLLAIAFNRSAVSGTSGAQGAGVLFVQPYVNSNNVENDLRPVADHPPIILDGGSSQQFTDKPWLAVGPDGAVHVAYATFLGGNKPHSIIWYQVSRDGGKTYTKSKLSEGDKTSNGTMIWVHPVTGWVDIVWRRRENPDLTNETDAIQFVRSTDGGKSFTSPSTIVSMPGLQRADGSLVSRPFDQGTGDGYFRNISNPAITTDDSKRVYVAWAERVQRVDSDGRVVRDSQIKLTVGLPSKTGNQVTWATPTPVDALTIPATTTTRGHQLRPAMWFAAGKIMLSYMHSREDDLVSVFTRQNVPDPGNPNGSVAKYTESQVPVGDLATSPPHPEKVFHDYLIDRAPAPTTPPNADVAPNYTNDPPLLRRHTEDVIALLGTPAPAGSSNPFPSFKKTKVSRYALALRDGALIQAQFNVLTRSLHCGGHCSFAGDYDDVVGPAWVPNATATAMVPNTAPATAVSFFVAWTDNRDVRPLADPTTFSRVGPTCTDPSATGTRNQNPYVARVGTGLFVYSFGNQKPLTSTFKRPFTVVFENALNATRSYRATIANQPAGGSASWLQFSNLTTLDLSIGPHSSASRDMYAQSTDAAAPIRIDVAEIAAPGGSLVPGGLQTSIVINPDRTTPALLPPVADGTIDGTNPATAEVFIPDVTSPDVTSANVDVTPDVTSPDVTSPDVTSPDVTSVAAEFPDVTSPDVTSPDVTSVPTMNPDVTSPDVTSIGPTNALTDTVFTAYNKGNTSASFAVNTFVTRPLCDGCKLQVIVTQPSSAPTQRGCEAKTVDTSAVVATVASPPLVSDPDNLTFNATNGSVGNLTVSIPTGGKVSVVYRLFDPNRLDNLNFTDEVGRRHSIDPTFDPATDIVPAVISQAVDTATAMACAPNCPSQGPVSMPLTIHTTALPAGTFGVSYSASLTAIGGVAPYSFTLTGGTLPAGLTLSADGAITGTPTEAGSSSLTFQVTDAASHTATRTFTLLINKATATVTLSNLNQVYDGTAKAVTVTTDPAGLAVTVEYSQNGSPVASPINAGSYNVAATVTDPGYAGSATGTLVIGQAPASLSLSNLVQAYDGTPKSVTVTTTPAGLTVVSVTYDGSTTAPSAVGSYAVVATLTNPNYTAAPATGTLTIYTPTTSDTLGFIGLQSPYAPPPKTFNSGRSIPLGWQYADANGQPIDSASANPHVEITGPFACGDAESGQIIVITPGNSDLQYFPGSVTWQVNWQSPSVTQPTCYNIRVVSGQTGQVNGPFLIELSGGATF